MASTHSSQAVSCWTFNLTAARPMPSMSPTEKILREEMDFWRHFIRERESRREPVHPRMREALAYAEHKLQKYLSSERRGVGGNKQMTGQRLH